MSELDDRSSDTYPANISTHSPLSVAAFNHRISIFAARLPPKKHIITALREKALYVFGLIMMMAWSVTYHSWITFILLLWSCYLWMARNRDQVTLKHAKWITLYAIVLILLQFVYSLNLYSNSELPAKLSNELSNEDDTLKTFGLRKKFRNFYKNTNYIMVIINRLDTFAVYDLQYVVAVIFPVNKSNRG